MTDYVGEEALADWLDFRREADAEADEDGGYCAATGAPLDPDSPWANSPEQDDSPLPF